MKANIGRRGLVRQGRGFGATVAAACLLVLPGVWAAGQAGGVPAAPGSRPPAAARAGGPGQAGAAGPQKPGATRTLTITVPAPGEYIVRVLPSPEARAAEELPTSFGDQKTTITIDPTRLGRSPRLAVDDVRTGNTAVVPLPGADTLQLRTADFSYVRRLDVKVTYRDKPVKTAQVTLTTADKRSESKTIGPLDQGVTYFDDVPSGQTRVAVRYGDNLTQTQDVPITSDHPAGVFTVPVAVGTAVPTVEPAQPGANSAPLAGPTSAPPAAPAGPPAAETGGGLGSLIGTVLGIAAVAAAGFLLYRWAQTGGMAATLKKAGIEVAGPPPGSDAGTPWQPNAPQAPVVADPSVCQFCGQKKDAAGNCACTLAGGSAGAPTVSAAAGQPRLIGTVGAYSGTVFPLSPNGSGVTVGRDATNGIALSSDTTVSRRHATIRGDAGAYTVTDEGSSNGVYVNGVRISGTQALRPGDEVQIGSTRFRFEV